MSVKPVKCRSMSYLEAYYCYIAPKLKEIDIFLKSGTSKITVYNVSRLLEITQGEVKSIMLRENIRRLDRKSFLKIMREGSSDICRLYSRETDCNSPYTYTREQISYIYEIELDLVNSICDSLNINEVTAYTLPEILANCTLNIRITV